MLKVKLRRRDQKETDYVYKWAMEWLGRTVEFGISKEEFSRLSEKTRSFLNGPKQFGAYLGSFRQNIRAGKLKPFLRSKKKSNEEKSVSLN